MSSAHLSLPEALWSQYNNHQDVLWSFLLPFGFWLSAFLYCTIGSKQDLTPLQEQQQGQIKKKPITFHKWDALHNIHNVGGMVVAALSLLFHKDDVFCERLCIQWHSSYFAVDLLDCLLRQDIAFSIHAIFCLLMGVGCISSTELQRIRAGSLTSFCEASTPFLYHAKKTRKPLHFAIFALVFFLCRIVWVPFVMRQMISNGVSWVNWVIVSLYLFYCLNLYWFAKIVRILVNGRSDKKQK